MVVAIQFEQIRKYLCRYKFVEVGKLLIRYNVPDRKGNEILFEVNKGKRQINGSHCLCKYFTIN